MSEPITTPTTTPAERTLHDFLQEEGVDWEAFLRRLSTNPDEAIREIRPRKGGLDGPLNWVLWRRPPPRVVRALLDVHGDAIVGTYSPLRGETALLQACISDAPLEVVRMVLEARPDAVRIASRGLFPLHCTYRLDHVKLLLRHHPEGVNEICHNDTHLQRVIERLVVQNTAPPFSDDLDQREVLATIRLLLEESMKHSALTGFRDLSGGSLIVCRGGHSPLAKLIESVLQANQEQFMDVEDDQPVWLTSELSLRLRWSVLELLIRAASFAIKGGLRRHVSEEGGGTNVNIDVEGSIVQGVLREVFTSQFHFLLAHICFVGGGTPMKMLALNRYGEQASLPDEDGNLPLIVACSRHEPVEVIKELLRLYPEAARLPNQGRVPLHVVIEKGTEFDKGLEAMILANPEALTTRDECKFYPFMSAAVDTSGISVDTVYRLLRANPHVISEFCRRDAMHGER